MTEPKRLSTESDSPLERAMLDAWRAGAPRASKERALSAATAAAASAGIAGGKAAAGAALAKAGAAAWLKWLIIGGAVGVGAVAGVAVQERSAIERGVARAPLASETSVANAASASSRVVEAPPADVPAAEPVASGAPISAAAPVPAPVRRAAPAVEAPSGSTLPEELSWLERAKAAMADRNPAGALALLDAYTARFVHPGLLPEATVLRIEALLDAGDRAAAHRAADAFLGAHPESPYAPRIRSLVLNANR